MPVIVNELVIRAVVEGAVGQAGRQAAGAGEGGGGDRESMISECVEQVLEILAQKGER